MGLGSVRNYQNDSLMFIVFIQFKPILMFPLHFFLVMIYNVNKKIFNLYVKNKCFFLLFFHIMSINLQLILRHQIFSSPLLMISLWKSISLEVLFSYLCFFQLHTKNLNNRVCQRCLSVFVFCFFQTPNCIYECVS